MYYKKRGGFESKMFICLFACSIWVHENQGSHACVVSNLAGIVIFTQPLII